MIIDEQFRKCAVFLYVDREIAPGIIRRSPIGTAFAVSIYDGQQTDFGFYYFITAGHVVQRSMQYRVLFIRMNTANGHYIDIPTDPYKHWIVHPDPKTDIAVDELTEAPPNADFRTISQDFLATDEFIKSKGVTLGDDLFSVCLFNPFEGEDQIEPVMFFGNISLMPRLITTKLLGPAAQGVKIEAYLTQWRSFGGASGAPVFVYFPPDRLPGILAVGREQIKLLGILHGHMNMDAEVEFIGDIAGFGTGKVPINTGVAVVIPAQKIHEALMLDELLEKRKAAFQQYQQSRPAPSF